MINELYIAVSAVLGLIVGLGIGIKGIKERDERIKELENELTISRNVVKSLNEDNVKLRKARKKNGGETDTTGL
jgi:hypothetical protein